MATFQGFELISNFSGIFAFLFTFSVTYGVLSVTNIFGEKNGKTLNPIVAVSISMLAAFSSTFVGIISMISPWFIIMMISFFFVILFLKFLGLNDSMLTDFFKGSAKEKRTVIYWIIVAVSVIIVMGISLQIGDEIGPYVGGGQSNVSSGQPNLDVPASNGVSGDSFAENLGAALFHPNVVGAFFIMLFASLAIRQLSQAD